MIADIHAHLDHQLLKDRLDEIIENAKKAGVKVIITNGIDKETNRETLKLAEKYDIVKPALGIYPIDALKKKVCESSYKDVDNEIKFIEKNKDEISAIGEVGMDYFNGKDVKNQVIVFKKIIELAKRIDKPLIIHSRKAEKDVIDILEKMNAKKVVLHCFCGKKSLVKKAAELGYYFSIPANIIRAENFQMTVNMVNISQILTETDAPYLSPYKNKVNEPAFIKETIKKIAELKGLDAKEVENIIWMNYMKMFV